MIAPSKEKPASNETHKTRMVMWTGVFAVAAIGIALVLFLVSQSSPGDKEPPKDTQSSKIAEVKPVRPKRESKIDTAPRSASEESITVEKPKPAEPPKSTSPWANKPPRVIKHRESDKKPRRFVYDSEELIADLLEIEPGTLMFGELPYGKRFNEDFKQAIMQKVKINPEDDEYTVALKKQVQAVKDDFKQILIDGGDVGEEMRKARNELKELGMYKETLKRELFALRNSGEYSSDDMKDFIEAANKMLEDKGLAPLKVPRVFLRNLELKESKAK